MVQGTGSLTVNFRFTFHQFANGPEKHTAQASALYGIKGLELVAVQSSLFQHYSLVSMSSQNIVIVGGGAAGVSIAVSLAAQLPKVGTGYRVVLVTAREVYVHLLAMLRLSVNRAAKVEETALIPYDAILPSNVGTVKIGAVSSIVPRSSNGGEVVLENGETIPYR